MPFTKGHKLARGGKRPNSGPKPAITKDLQARLFTPDLARAAVQVLREKLTDGDLDAAKYVADRMFGKPRQQVDLEAAGELRLVVEYVRASPSAPGA